MFDHKTLEFKIAMDKYNKHYIYNKFGLLISSLVVSMQILCIYDLSYNINVDISIIAVCIILINSYILTDFINGIIHMYMDNNTNYKSIFGPFIAAFHIHHQQLSYKQKNPFLVYFAESGSKFWLAAYLIILIYLQNKIDINFYINLLLVTIGIFSSFAELSHYWCHNASIDNKTILQLQKARILLSKTHHAKHHTKDNINYAFLNGITDPIINIIAKYLYKGYKNNSDLHVLAYYKQTK